MNAYSKDLRLKVPAAIDRGIPRKEVSELFGISRSTIIHPLHGTGVPNRATHATRKLSFRKSLSEMRFALFAAL